MPPRPGVLTRLAQSLSAPARTLPTSTSAIASIACMAFCMALALANIEPSFVFTVPDSGPYMQIARLDTAHVGLPFASRQLGGLVVHAFMVVFHLSIYGAYQLQAAISFATMLTVLYWLMAQTSAPRWMLLAIAVLPYWAGQMQYIVLPDVFYSALHSVLLLFLARRQMLAASLMMFPLMLARESTSLTLVCFLIALWGSLRWVHRLSAVLAVVAAAKVVGYLTRFSPPNVEHIPPAFYMVAKVPWNLLRNVVGAMPWSNVNTDLCTVPTWSAPLHFGRVHAVGLCGFNHVGQLALVAAVLTQFGLLPLLLAQLWFRHRRFAGRSPLLRFALLYGGASFVMAPLIGNWMSHLTGYAWPLFLVAVPLLMNEFATAPGIFERRQELAGVAFFALHIAAYLASRSLNYSIEIACEVPVWIAGYIMLRIWFGSASPAEGIVSPAQTATA